MIPSQRQNIGSSVDDENARLHVGNLMTTFQTGGLERVVENIAVNAREFGVRSTAFAYTEDGELRQVFEERGIDAVFLPTRPGIRYELGPRLAYEVQRRGIDVLHSPRVSPPTRTTRTVAHATVPAHGNEWWTGTPLLR